MSPYRGNFPDSQSSHIQVFDGGGIFKQSKWNDAGQAAQNVSDAPKIKVNPTGCGFYCRNFNTIPLFFQ